MDAVRQNLALLINAKGLNKEDIIIDLNLSQGEFVPLTKNTVGYVVDAVVLNSDGEVLMVQEAKTSCYGKWYLPAGRMEPNETIEQAVQREVMEESGLMFEPTTILCVEALDCWFRFTFCGQATGGKLKSLAEKDSESLQAEWWPLSKVFSPAEQRARLRGIDILPLIERAAKVHSGVYHRHHEILPVTSFHEKLILRMVIVSGHSERSKMQLLVGLQNRPHLPSVIMTGAKKAIVAVLRDAFGMTEIQGFTIHGILSVEYDGRPAHRHDGFCLTVLASVDDETLKIAKQSCYAWMDVEDGGLVHQIEPLLQPESLPNLLCK